MPHGGVGEAIKRRARHAAGRQGKVQARIEERDAQATRIMRGPGQKELQGQRRQATPGRTAAAEDHW